MCHNSSHWVYTFFKRRKREVLNFPEKSLQSSHMIPFFPKKSLSHLLILISIAVSLFGFIDGSVIGTFGFRGLTFASGDIFAMLSQIVLFQFLHWGVLHLLLNSYFLYVAGPEIEARMSRSRYLWFFLSTTLFVAMGLYFFENPFVITIGISGFCMALLAYLWIDLTTTRHPMANQIGLILLLNIAFGLFGGISFYGHLFGAIWGLIWWYGRKWNIPA